MIMVAVVGIVITIVENVLMLPAYGNPSLADTLVISTFHRSVFLVIEIVVNTVLLAVILIGAKRKIKLRKPSDFVIATVISLLLLILVDASVWLEMQVGDDLTALGYIAAIAFSSIAIAVLFWILLYRLSRENEMQTELLLREQREQMYKASVAAANGQIERIASIRHDMKNSVMAIGSLIDEGEYEKARALCDSATEKLTTSFTPAHTQNPVLNAILNVEKAKALAQKIDFTAEIQDALLFVSDSDVISIVGNLCDNAIEHLSSLPEDKRRMQQVNFYQI